MMVLPSCPTTPSGSGMPTSSVEVASTAITVNEKPRFMRMIRRIFRLNPME